MFKPLIFTLIMMMSLLLCVPTFAAFTDSGATGLTGAVQGSADWGDYDNDGRLDLLITGSMSTGYITNVYRQKDDGNFELAQSLTGVYHGDAAWGDYDNDGDLDIAVCGESSGGNIASIYQQDGSGSFNVLTGTSLASVTNCTVSWIDVDRDGDLDLSYIGTDGSDPQAYLYINDNGAFSSATDITGAQASHGSMDWGDLDKDGYPDLLVSGNNGDAMNTIFHNINGSFHRVYQWTGIKDGASIWGDYDGDGRLDVASIGLNDDSGNVSVSNLYRQTSDYFENVTPIDLNTRYLPDPDLNYTRARAAWGDQDNDGDLDLLVMVDDAASTGFGAVQINSGADDFTSFESLPGLRSASAAWGDYDNDGDLDIFMTGQDVSLVACIFLNDAADTTANEPPTAPTDLKVYPHEDNTVYLSWLHGNDDHTPAPGLTYNVRIGSSSGAGDILSPMADLTTGKRRLPARGNFDHNLFARNHHEWQTGVPYYWSVQAVDNNFKGSAWADEGTFTFYPLNVDFTGTGSGEMSLNGAAYYTDDFTSNFTGTVKIMVRAAPDSVFQGWGGACSGNDDTCLVTMDQAQNVTATFDTVPTYDLTLNPSSASGSGMVRSEVLSVYDTQRTQPVHAGDSVTLTAIPAHDSRFDGWTGDGCSGDDETCTIVMDQARTITPSFVLADSVHTLTLQKDGNGSGRVGDDKMGINCGSTCSGDYTSDSQVILSVSPDPGSGFDGWSDPACSGNYACEITMDQDKTITTTFNTDDDEDGISTAMEDAGPNNGDGNNDGIPDSTQSNVATFTDIHGNDVTMTTSEGRFTRIAFHPPLEETDIPLPAGVIRYYIEGLSRDASTVVTTRLFNNTTPYNTYYTYVPNQETRTDELVEFLKGDGNWGATITKAETYTDVTIYIRDGSDQDMSGGIGRISAGGGPSYADSTGGGSNSGCFINSVR